MRGGTRRAPAPRECQPAVPGAGPRGSGRHAALASHPGAQARSPVTYLTDSYCPEGQRARARSSWTLLMLERPLILRFWASAYSCSFVRPAAPECDRSPPRLPDEMSRVDVLLAVRDSPDRARSLFTVLAAISVARFGLSPRCFALSLMCSYCRSRFGLDPRGTAVSFRASQPTTTVGWTWPLPPEPQSTRALPG